MLALNNFRVFDNISKSPNTSQIRKQFVRKQNIKGYKKQTKQKSVSKMLTLFNQVKITRRKRQVFFAKKQPIFVSVALDIPKLMFFFREI